MREDQTKGASKWIRGLLGRPEMGIFIPLLILCALTAILNPNFLSKSNMADTLNYVSLDFIIAVGMTFTIISGGMDLSVGSTVALGGYVTGLALVNHVPVFAAVLLGLLTGAVIGLANGLIIVMFRIPPFITTLGMMNIVKGVVNVLSEGRPVFPFPDSFNALAQTRIWGFPTPVYMALLLLIAAVFLLKNTSFGRSVMAVGGNEAAANTSGIDVNKVKVITYVMTAVLASFSGILLASKSGTATPGAGDGYEMNIIAAVIIGGTSLSGGSGSIISTAIGCALIKVLNNAMVILSINTYWQNIVIGAIIIAAVIIDTLRRESALRGGKSKRGGFRPSRN
ncbi:MAG: ABC transporter permease [Eubacteriales bacterium]|nr:ABC transporter permease [Eubacteriales bacterium]